MNEPTYISQAEDIDFVLTVKRKDGTLLDMSAAPRCYVIVHDGYGNVYGKFKKGAAATGWEVMDTTNDNVGVLRFKILTTVTKTMKPGRYYIEWRVRYNSGSHADDLFFDVVESGIEAFGVKESEINKLVSLPA